MFLSGARDAGADRRVDRPGVPHHRDMKLSPLPVRRPGAATSPVSVDLTAAEAPGEPAPLDDVLAWLTSLES